MANFDSEFSAFFFQGFQATQKLSRPKFTSRLVGIPLQFHFLEPKIYSRRFSAYGGDRNFSSATPKSSWGIKEGDATKQKSVKRSAFSLNDDKVFTE